MLCFYGTNAGVRIVYMKNKYFFGWLLFVGEMALVLVAGPILGEI